MFFFGPPLGGGGPPTRGGGGGGDLLEALVDAAGEAFHAGGKLGRGLRHPGLQQLAVGAGLLGEPEHDLLDDFGAQLILLGLEGGVQFGQGLLQALGRFGVLRKQAVALPAEPIVQVGQHGAVAFGQCRLDAGRKCLRRRVERGDSP